MILFLLTKLKLLRLKVALCKKLNTRIEEEEENYYGPENLF
jgi:hypothetical protein